MIRFDKYGNPSPIGIINISMNDFEEIFVHDFRDSQTRTKIFSGYENFIYDFQIKLTEKFSHWINGSYTTNKKDPNDIDIVTIVNANENFSTTGELFKTFLTIGGSKEKYLVDAYFIPVYSEEDPRYIITKQYFDYWSNFFGHDRRNRPKGLIQINFNKI